MLILISMTITEQEIILDEHVDKEAPKTEINKSVVLGRQRGRAKDKVRLQEFYTYFSSMSFWSVRRENRQFKI